VKEKIINLTNHNLVMYKNGKLNAVILPSGPPLRLQEKVSQKTPKSYISGYPLTTGYHIDSKNLTPSLDSLPYPKESIICVSKTVLMYLADNKLDSKTTGYFFVCPDMDKGVVKDENGKTLGISGFRTFEGGR